MIILLIGQLALDVAAVFLLITFRNLQRQLTAHQKHLAAHDKTNDALRGQMAVLRRKSREHW